MYKYDIRLLNRRVAFICYAYVAFAIFWGLFLLDGAISMVGGVALLLILARTIRDDYRKCQERKKSPPFLDFRGSSLFYSEGDSKYQVTIAYKDVTEATLKKYFGFPCLIIKIGDQKRLKIWNLEKSEEICNRLNELIEPS